MSWHIVWPLCTMDPARLLALKGTSKSKFVLYNPSHIPSGMCTQAGQPRKTRGLLKNIQEGLTSGTTPLRKVSMSSRTSGSAFCAVPSVEIGIVQVCASRCFWQLRSMPNHMTTTF